MNYTKELVLDYYSSEFDRSRNTACEYCGSTTSITRDHVIPVSYSGITRTYNKNDTIRCCSECNSTLGSKLVTNIPERAEYLIGAYQRKYKKILDFPLWNKDELQGMSNELKKSIIASEDSRDCIIKRLSNLSFTAYGDDIKIKVNSIDKDLAKISKATSMLLRGIDIGVVAKDLGLTEKTVKSFFRDKKYHQKITKILYDFGMNLDLNVIKYNKSLIRDINNEINK